MTISHPSGDEAAYHHGYEQGLKEVAALVAGLTTAAQEELDGVLAQIRRRIEVAYLGERSSLASAASGDTGY
ncbi:MAG: hypothetical protein ACT4PV_03175 [Planctomycetaceae bacterium]